MTSVTRNESVAADMEYAIFGIDMIDDPVTPLVPMSLRFGDTQGRNDLREKNDSCDLSEQRNLELSDSDCCANERPRSGKSGDRIKSAIIKHSLSYNIADYGDISYMLTGNDDPYYTPILGAEKKPSNEEISDTSKYAYQTTKYLWLGGIGSDLPKTVRMTFADLGLEIADRIARKEFNLV